MLGHTSHVVEQLVLQIKPAAEPSFVRSLSQILKAQCTTLECAKPQPTIKLPGGFQI